MLNSPKRFVDIGGARVAFHDEGAGSPIVFLHGCPFGAFEWHKVLPALASSHRCIAPDLLGLADTETPEHADWSLPAQARMVVALLDALGLDRAHIIGHDHGGAVAQLLAACYSSRVDRLVLANVEAYDNWPSADERPFVRATQIPLLGDVVLWFWARRRILRATLVRAKAVYDPRALSTTFVDAMIRANLGTYHRRMKTKRFLAGQFDPRNNRVTSELIDDLRRFDHPTLLLWAADDAHFGPEWAERLREDIPGVQRLALLTATGHLLMEERPEEFARLVGEFLS